MTLSPAAQLDLLWENNVYLYLCQGCGGIDLTRTMCVWGWGEGGGLIWNYLVNTFTAII